MDVHVYINPELKHTPKNQVHPHAPTQHSHIQIKRSYININNNDTCIQVIHQKCLKTLKMANVKGELLIQQINKIWHWTISKPGCSDRNF